MDVPPILWTPPDDVRRRSRIGAYLDWLDDERGLRFEAYDDLWRWSVTDLSGFWASVWNFARIGPPVGTTAVLEQPTMPGARWFTGVHLNYAERTLRLDARGDDDVVLVARSEAGPAVELTASELRALVARVREGLRRLGVGPGDRVAGYLPNVPEAVAAYLATASLGAIWSSCAPEFGTRSVVDRFGQIEPKVLLAVDGYRYGGQDFDRTDALAAIRDALPGLAATIVLPRLGPGAAPLPATIAWRELIADEAPLVFEPVAFDHPLAILYSSGTTGLPKPIVHGHGGILLEHWKALALHHDLGPADRLFWFTTTGWMMWNYLVSGLLADATVVLYDGSPAHPDLSSLWLMAAETGVTTFGSSAPYLLACRREELRPGDELDLSALRAVGSTGAPLPAAGFRWVHEAVGTRVQVQSVSGGTDVCTAFVGAAPMVPVWEGEISCRMLGCAVEAFDASGRSVVGEQGELVLTAPLPSMPVAFWNDPDGSRYRAAYFADYPGAWRHGDWITITERGSCIISGRSDATLNRGGVRIGTAEVYAVVEALPEVADALVVHLEDPHGAAGELILFLALREGRALDDELDARVRAELRSALSPRHVPDRIVAVPAVPRTLSGKKLEVPIKRILSGVEPEEAASRGSLANPEALDAFVELARRRGA